MGFDDTLAFQAANEFKGDINQCINYIKMKDEQNETNDNQFEEKEDTNEKVYIESEYISRINQLLQLAMDDNKLEVNLYDSMTSVYGNKDSI